MDAEPISIDKNSESIINFYGSDSEIPNIFAISFWFKAYNNEEIPTRRVLRRRLTDSNIENIITQKIKIFDNSNLKIIEKQILISEREYADRNIIENNHYVIDFSTDLSM